MKRNILLIFFMLLLLLLFLSSCNSERKISGEIIEWTMNESAGVSSFIVQTDGGNQVGIIVSSETFVWPSDKVSQEDFRFNEQDGVLVSVSCEGDKRELATNGGTKLAAYTANVIRITGLLTRGALTVSDGTKVDLIQGSNAANYYQLSDGTELLCERNPIGPENVYVGEVESFDDLSETAKKNVSTYYTGQGLLYDVQTELERAYQDYASHMGSAKFSSRTVGQEISPTASSDRVMYFVTSVTLPVDGNICTKMRLGAAFDRETGAYLNALDLFSCGQAEILSRLLTIAGISELALRDEMKTAFQPEYIIFFPDNLEICFPEGALASQEYSYQIGLDYDERLTSILHNWAIPQSSISQD